MIGGAKSSYTKVLLWVAVITVMGSSMYYVMTHMQPWCPTTPSSASLTSLQQINPATILIDPIRDTLISALRNIQERPQSEQDALSEQVKVEAAEAYDTIQVVIAVRDAMERMEREKEMVANMKRDIDIIENNAVELAKSNRDEWCALESVQTQAATLRNAVTIVEERLTSKQATFDSVRTIYDTLNAHYKPSWRTMRDPKDVPVVVKEEVAAEVGWIWWIITRIFYFWVFVFGVVIAMIIIHYFPEYDKRRLIQKVGEEIGRSIGTYLRTRRVELQPGQLA